MRYAYYRKLAALIASLKNRQNAFVEEFGNPLPRLGDTIEALERQKQHAQHCVLKFREPARDLAIFAAWGPDFWEAS